MSTLVVNLPAQHVWVRKEYLRDHVDGHGEYVRGIWVSVKSIPGRAFYFETFLPDYGAVYDKLPISAFVSSPAPPSPDLPLDELQFWNAMDYGVVCVVKQFIASMDFEIRPRKYPPMSGTYICTLDNYHSDVDCADYSTSENPSEHKAFTVIELENGQYAAYPNNRMRVYDVSQTPKQALQPDFRVSTQYYQVEAQGARFGDTDSYFYEETIESNTVEPEQEIKSSPTVD